MEHFSRIFSLFSDFFQVKLLVALMGGTIGGFLSKNNAGARGYAQSLSIWFLGIIKNFVGAVVLWGIMRKMDPNW